MPHASVYDSSTIQGIEDLIKSVGGESDTFQLRMVRELIQTSLKLIEDGHDSGQLKLLNSSLKELRYAYQVFNKYKGKRKIAIFGSARTPEDHPDYLAAVEFSEAMARKKWMSITGAGDGIMKAGLVGPKREASFGLSIRLPFETTANEVIENDPKLINFRYFFTRKLMFLSHSDAIAIFPGGFGTQDEAFESLTLIQTGKSQIVPIVLLEGDQSEYWDYWNNYVCKNLLERKMINDEDTSIYYIASSIDDAVDHILKFYRVYHSSRYVGDQLVLRINQELRESQIVMLNDEFAKIIRTGCISQCGPLDGEDDYLDLPRLSFHHTRNHFGLVRALIDRINEFAENAA